MSKLMTIDVGGTTMKFTPPEWVLSKSPENSQCWECRLYSHQLLGAISINAVYLEREKTGTVSLCRNGDHLCTIIQSNTACFESAEEMKDRAYECALDQLTSACVYMQNYLAQALKTNPGSVTK